MRKKVKKLKEKLRKQEKVIVEKDKRKLDIDEEIAKRDETIDRQDVVLQKLEKSIDELEGKRNAAVNEIEKKLDGETTTPSSGKPPRYPFPWPQKASTSGSYRLRLRFVKFTQGEHQ